MPEETITFELIRKIQREEQRTPKLSILPESFYQNVKSYFLQKRRIIESSKKNTLELKNIERLVEDIFERRERKIVLGAMMFARSGVMIENMNDEEKQIFDSLVSLIKQRREQTFSEVFESQNVQKETVSLIVFKENVSEFVGADLKTYGPFKKGDIARVPEANMRILLERGMADSFQVEK